MLTIEQRRVYTRAREILDVELCCNEGVGDATVLSRCSVRLVDDLLEDGKERGDILDATSLDVMIDGFVSSRASVFFGSDWHLTGDFLKLWECPAVSVYSIRKCMVGFKMSYVRSTMMHAECFTYLDKVGCGIIRPMGRPLKLVYMRILR
jgi:hypothetical protein